LLSQKKFRAALDISFLSRRIGVIVGSGVALAQEAKITFGWQIRGCRRN
jgi:hypothetical protein